MVEGMDDRLGAEKHEDGSSNTITMSLSRCFRSFALDVVTTWTFGHCAESLPTFHSDLFEILDVAAESVIYVSFAASPCHPFVNRLSTSRKAEPEDFGG